LTTGFRRLVSLLICRIWGADSGPPAGFDVYAMVPRSGHLFDDFFGG